MLSVLIQLIRICDCTFSTCSGFESASRSVRSSLTSDVKLFTDVIVTTTATATRAIYVGLCLAVADGCVDKNCV